MATTEGFISKATLRYARVTPQKARLVVDLIRGEQVGKALDRLTGTIKKTSPLVRKLLLSAVAGAREKDKHLDVDDLFVKAAWVEEGPKLKRMMPRAQGRGTPIRKRMSTITIVLDEQVTKRKRRK